MNCESSDAILQTYIVPVSTNSDTFSDEDEEIISEAESNTEIPVEESDLHNYRSQIYDENGIMIGDEDHLGNTLDVRARSISLMSSIKIN